MLGLKAFDFDSRTTQATVAKRINRAHKVTSYRRAFEYLSTKEWKEGKAGRGHGIWLTAGGRRTAEEIQQKDANEE